MGLLLVFIKRKHLKNILKEHIKKTFKIFFNKDYLYALIIGLI